MANPYYIRPSRTAQNPLAQGANLYLSFSDLNQRGEIAKGRQDVMRERNKLLRRQTDAEYGVSGGEPAGPGAIGGVGQPVKGLAERRIEARERANELAAQQTPITEKNFGRDKVAMFEGSLKQLGLDKAFTPILDSMKSLADNPKYNHREVYGHYKANWPVYQKAVIDGLAEELTKAMETNPARAEQIKGIMQQIEADETGSIIDMAMPTTAQAVANEQALIQSKQTTPRLYETTEGWQPADKAMGLIKPTRGMEIETADGTKIRTNVLSGGETDLTKPTQNEIQKEIVKTDDAIERVSKSIKSWSPEFSTFPFRAGSAWEGFKQKLGMGEDGEAANKMVEFKRWYKNAMRDYGIAIQELGKGNLTKNEERIYGAGLPDPGNEIWPKDPPKVYYEALIDRYKGLNAINARRYYYLNSGFAKSTDEYKQLVESGMVHTVEQMQEIIDQKGKELEEFFKSQGKSDSEVEALVKQQLNSIFGIGK